MAVTEDTTGILYKIKWTLTSAADGSVSSASTKRYNGIVHRLVTIPDGGGTAPTAAWDLTITDGDSVDVLNGLGADRSATATEQKANTDGLGDVKSSLLTANVTNAGNAKGVTVILYILDIDKGTN